MPIPRPSPVPPAVRALAAFAAFAAFAILVAAPPARAGEVAAPTARDPHTYANVDEFRVKHLALDLDVDFAKRRLAGTAELVLERLQRAARTVVLDSWDLAVTDAWLVGADGERERIEFSLGPRDPVLGRPLRLELPAKLPDGPVRVAVAYRTSPEARGLQWLTPAQTAGKRHPFLFTQSQAINARSWIPLQDTPGVRFTFEARIRAPKALRAVMGASNDPAAPLDGEFAFEMPQPVPSYLTALAVGELAFRPTGPRSGVYAEPSVVEAAAREFEDTEAMIATAEKLYGPYRWGRYDVLVLPPAFPWGGMENPRLTFVNPTILAGDKSLVALVAHELAHSWSGNLVTNASWRDFWLNEGFTVLLESEIVGAIYGPERRAQEDALGFQNLERELAELPPRAQVLAIDLRGRDPEEGVTDIPYEKGRSFLVWLESRFGREKFGRFLRGWFDSHAFRSVTTEDFLGYLEKELLAPNPGVVSAAEVRRWIYEPGLPEGATRPTTTAFVPVDRERQRFLEGAPAAELDVAGWNTQQWLHFLDNAPVPASHARLAALDGAFRLSEAKNSEVLFSWLRLAVRSDYRPAYGALEKFLTGVGRRKFVRPLYEDLAKTPEGRAFAERVYRTARAGYHPVLQGQLDELLKGAPPPAG